MKAILIVLISIACVNAWVSRIRSEPNTENFGHCYTTAHKLGAMAAGEERRVEGTCANAICGTGREIQILGCGSVAVEPPCRVVEGDLSKPYPKCCFDIVCDIDHRPKLNKNVVEVNDNNL